MLMDKCATWKPFSCENSPSLSRAGFLAASNSNKCRFSFYLTKLSSLGRDTICIRRLAPGASTAPSFTFGTGRMSLIYAKCNELDTGAVGRWRRSKNNETVRRKVKKEGPRETRMYRKKELIKCAQAGGLCRRKGVKKMWQSQAGRPAGSKADEVVDDEYPRNY